MRKFAAANRSLRSARQIPCTLCSRPFCWYFCWYRGSKRSWRISLFQHRKAVRQAQQVAARPFKQWADKWLAKKKVENVKRGRIVAVRDPKTIEVLELRVGYVKDRFGKLCRQDIKRPDCSLSCVHTKPRESWKPATAYVASVRKSATMPMSKATPTFRNLLLRFSACGKRHTYTR